MRNYTLMFLIVIAVNSTAAYAMLGGRAETAGTNKSTVKSTHGVKYIETVSKDSSVHVRQFVAGSGQVFAVAWSGHPDLTPILGEYAADFSKQETAHPPRSGKIPYRKVQGGRVVVEFWDTLRRVQGKAYVPSLMPTGVSADQIHMGD